MKKAIGRRSLIGRTVENWAGDQGIIRFLSHHIPGGDAARRRTERGPYMPCAPPALQDEAAAYPWSFSPHELKLYLGWGRRCDSQSSRP